ncbi:MAG: hypothetical protein ACRDG3_10505 [Tepidiformaceae bacterium]
MTQIVKFVRAFGFFWWDFIVGDSIVLAVGSVATILIAFGLAHSGVSAAAQVVLPAAVLLTLTVALGKRWS